MSQANKQYIPPPIVHHIQLTAPVTKSLSMRQLYKQVRHIVDNGIEGYRVVKKYQDPAAMIKSREDSKYKKKVKQLKRGSYLQDEFKIKKDIPSVWKYDILQKQKVKAYKPKHVPQKKTYVDQAIQRSKKQHIPPPGQYDNILQMMGSKIAGTHHSSFKRLNTEKITYLDNAEYEATQTPGVGEYQVGRFVRSKTEQSVGRLDRKPQYWRQHHKQLQKKSVQKQKNSGPDMRVYNPRPLDYELFEHKKKVSRTQSQHRLKRLQKSQRFKTDDADKVNLGPGKYDILNEWRPKQKNKKGILSIISKVAPPSIYYH